MIRSFRPTRGAMPAMLLALVVGLALSPTADATSFLDRLNNVLKELPKPQAQADSSSAAHAANKSGRSDFPAFPVDFGTPEGTAKLAGAAGFADVGGIKLGMTISEAKAALKTLNPHFRLTPDIFRLKELPGHDMLDHLSAYHKESMYKGREHSESVFLAFTTYPSVERVSSITREINYTSGETPSVPNVLSALEKKYGPATISDPGSTALLWVYDAQGHPLSKAQLKPFRNTDNLAAGGCERGGLGAADALNGVQPDRLAHCGHLIELYAQIFVVTPTFESPTTRGIPKDWNVYSDMVVPNIKVVFTDFPLGFSSVEALRKAALNVDHTEENKVIQKSQTRSPNL